MKHLLAKSSRTILDELASKRALLAFDFDGTLAPIVEEPDRAYMRASTARALARLALAYPCAIITGRRRGDLLPRVSGIELVHIVGNHGAEWLGEESLAVSHARRQIRLFRERIENALQRIDGVTIEDKGLSLAVHLRNAACPEKAEALALRAIEPIGKARIFGGKRVLNILPLGAPHKGTALAKLVKEVEADAALYIGDDTTDEDAFLNPGVQSFCSVRVAPNGPSRASYYLDEQGEIDALLDILLELRRPSGASS